MSFVENQEKNAKYRGYNPEFVERVLAKRRQEQKQRYAENAERLLKAESELARSRRNTKKFSDSQARLKNMQIELDRKELAIDAMKKVYDKHIHTLQTAIDAENIEITKRIPAKRIMYRACKVFRISPTELKSFRRNAQVVLARQFICYWATRLTLLSLSQIGSLIGGRDHTTILHGKQQYRIKRAKMGRYLREAR